MLVITLCINVFRTHKTGRQFVADVIGTLPGASRDRGSGAGLLGVGKISLAISLDRDSTIMFDYGST